MKVALFYPWIYLKGGPERTILETLSRSRHEWIIYTTHYDADGTFPELRQMGIREQSRVSVERNYGSVIGACLRIAMTRLDLRDIDALLLCCDGVGVFLNVRNARVPVINLCFTPLRAVYDSEYRKRHLARQGRVKALAICIEKIYKLVDRMLWRRFSSVIAISETVRERVAQGGLRPRDEMTVMYPGVDGARIKPSDRFEPFFFLPGRIMWTKNIELGISAYHLFRKNSGRKLKLVIAGMVDAKSQDYYTRLRTLAASDPLIEFHVSPTDAQMRDYYDRCRAVLFTAFNEDLGITPMEAMSSGKPVIAVNRGGPREVVEDKVTGLLVNDDPESFADAMQWIAADELRCRAAGRAAAERVKRFTWEKFVVDLDDHIEKVAARSRT